MPTRTWVLGIAALAALAAALFFLLRGCEKPPAPPPPAEVSATKTYALPAGDEALAHPGDTIRYTVVIRNTGAQQADSVVFKDAPDAHTTLLTGSVALDGETAAAQVTSGNADADAAVVVTLAEALAGQGGRLVIHFAVQVKDPLPDGVDHLVNQGAVSGSNFADVLTDDPSAGANTGEADPTVTLLDTTQAAPPPPPPAPTISGAFCAVCRGETAPFLIEATQAASYRDQCALCPPALDPAAGGYTLIVASRLDRGRAEADAVRFRQRLGGLPVEVLAGTSNGETRYRVAVGQYATLEQALAQRAALAAALPPDTWVLRL